ncbi:hypothetical protein D3C84_829990 [compost metagenome]
MPHFNGQWSLQGIDKPGQLRQTLGREAFRQLQPKWRHPFTQRAEQLQEGFGGGQLLAQIATVADLAGKLGGEAKVFGHGVGPALHGAGSRARVEGRVAFYGIEYLGIEIKKIGGFGVRRIQVVAPGVFAPGWATEVIRQQHQMYRSRPSTSASQSTKPAVLR